MSAPWTNIFERYGLKMDWRCRRSFLIWFLTPVFAAGLLLVVLLALNPQSSRFVYIFQSMFTTRGGPHPWGEAGPKPPVDYTGVWYRWHSNGRLSFEEHYTKGKLNGPFRAWDRSGHRWLETAYHAGRPHGDYILFYESGTTNKIKHFFEEEPVGCWLHFYRDGSKWEERFFSAPGVPDGEEVVWSTNGAVKFSRTWRKGEPWEGHFTLYRGTNWYGDQYEFGRLVSTTNLGPIPPWELLPAIPGEPAKK